MLPTARSFITLFCAASTLCSAALIDDLATPKTWELQREELLATMPRKAYFSRIDTSSIRIPQQDVFKAADFSHGDVVLRWDAEKKLERVEIIVYNKGDDGDLSQDEFKSKLKEIELKLNELLQVEGKARRMDKRDTGVKGQTKIWEPEGCGSWLLESSSSGRGKTFNSEFIRLTIGADVEKGGAADAARRATLKENVVKEDDGTVWIKNIPMVDQGEKGYCVPATVARVFAYYGMDGVDQHAMAALCQSRSGGGGTTMPQMRAALQDLGRAFHFRVKTSEDCSIENMIALYNKEAKKQKAPQLTARMGAFIMIDADIMRAARTRNATKVKKWMAEVKKSIDEGIPVLWSVMLGIFNEQGLPQSSGGHMRLIIGYNLENETIIYSDSWGGRHARKEMPLDDAFSMTVERNIMRLSR
ncbi:MAG: C39 family peptidase [Akkermansia sp.]|nr:C39 family peptidase [Akkermansia sp.]